MTFHCLEKEQFILIFDDAIPIHLVIIKSQEE